jgi:tellurite resistance protein TerC
MLRAAAVVTVHAVPLEVPFWAWVLFGAVVAVSLVADLVAHRGGKSVSRAHALAWTVAWITVAMSFAAWVAVQFGAGIAMDFVTAYLIEKSLSVDNLFLFVVLFARLGIPPAEQHRVLFWGILGALVSRAVFIGFGTALLARWHEAVYVLGVFLVYTGVKTALTREGKRGGGRALAFLQRHLPVTPRLHGHRFLVSENGRTLATPLLLALIAIEATDILFALDSVPAVFAVSTEPFIVYSSNVFAILGMRALYLVLASLLNDLKYLHYGLGAILAFAGAKMLTSSVLHLPHWVSLLFIVTVLFAAIVPSVVRRRAKALTPSPR